MWSLLPSQSSAGANQPIFEQSVSGGLYSFAIPTGAEILQTISPNAVEGASIDPWQVISFGASIVWTVGVASLFLYGLFSFFRLKKRLLDAKKVGENVYQTSRVDTAFVLGWFRPKIYLPEGLTESETSYILAHERVHLSRKDHFVKVLAWLLVCVHWMNPLVWLSFYLMNKDMEMSCDEAVIRQMGPGIKKDYSNSLLTLAVKQTPFGGNPLAFSEGEEIGRAHV